MCMCSYIQKRAVPLSTGSTHQYMTSTCTLWSCGLVYRLGNIHRNCNQGYIHHYCLPLPVTQRYILYMIGRHMFYMIMALRVQSGQTLQHEAAVWLSQLHTSYYYSAYNTHFCTVMITCTHSVMPWYVYTYIRCTYLSHVLLPSVLPLRNRTAEVGLYYWHYYTVSPSHFYCPFLLLLLVHTRKVGQLSVCTLLLYSAAFW